MIPLVIGETAPWKPLWISMYNAKCLTLDSYRHGRVLFAGDAGHLVPIFGVRGLNSGLDDAANLAWKLAWVLRGHAAETLLDSYSHERVHATRQNLAYGAKSTEFMAPPDFGFRLLREATLRLSLADGRISTVLADAAAANGMTLGPDGRLVVCEFSRPVWGPFRTLYTEYLMRALPPVARTVSKEPDAYVYLAESIRAWPDQRGLAELIAESGWSSVDWRNLTSGIVAVHRAVKPS